MINEEGLRDWFGKSKSKDGKKGWVNVVTGGTCASDEPGEGTPKCVSSAKRASMTKAERLSASRRKKKADPGQQQKSGAAKPTYVKTDSPKKMKKEEVEVTEAKDKPGKGSGKKDACYHKVKSRYSVWPSAYASGALVKCRKKGAANWGNSTKKEEYMALPEMTEIQINAMRNAGIEVEVVNEDCWDGYEKKGMKTMFGKRYPNCVKKKKTKKEEVELTAEGKADGDPCWDTHKQVGMKKKGGKMVPNCVPKEEVETVEEAVRIPSKTGNIYLVGFSWRGKYMMMKLFFPEVKRPTRDEVQSALDGIYPGCNVMRYDMTPYQPGEQLLHVEDIQPEDNPLNDANKNAEYRQRRQKVIQYKAARKKTTTNMEETEIEEGAAWTKKEGKNKSGGLNEKGRKSYERENPGSDLKAPSKKVGNPRRASFCARMKGMKKKLTSKKTASDPDSRINKSLRAWNC
tara:strand:+ start:791 stop:2164 length:1374 start_codon:yes stop_codon:yes gene_type:complete